MDRVNRFSVLFTIIATSVLQVLASVILYWEKFTEDVEIDIEYNGYEGILNLVVIAIVIIYLSQDAAQQYKVSTLKIYVRDNSFFCFS